MVKKDKEYTGYRSISTNCCEELWGPFSSKSKAELAIKCQRNESAYYKKIPKKNWILWYQPKDEIAAEVFIQKKAGILE